VEVEAMDFLIQLLEHRFTMEEVEEVLVHLETQARVD
jgi:hypothetical protein